MPPPFLTILSVTLTLWPHFSQNCKSIKNVFLEMSSVSMTFTHMTFKPISLWPDYRKYWCKVSLKSLHWFRNYHFSPDFLARNGRLWPLNQWPSQCHQFRLHLLVINCESFIKYLHSFRMDAQTHTHWWTDKQKA